MKTRLSKTADSKRVMHRLGLSSTAFDSSAPMNREQRREVARLNKKRAVLKDGK